MNSRRTDWSLDDLDRGTVLTAAVLVGIGSLLGVAGVSVGCVAVIGACRRWYRRADLSPQELARLKWEQARAAASAGAGAWQELESKYAPRSARADS